MNNIRYVKEKRSSFEELYNLQDDPEELNDLSKTRKTKMNELSLQLDKIIKAEGTKDTAIQMDAETEEKLKSLGYIQ